MQTRVRASLVRHVGGLALLLAVLSGCAPRTVGGDGGADSSTDSLLDVLPSPDATEAGQPGQFGAACAHDSDCMSGICLSSGHCTQPCTGRTDCPASPNWSCVSLPGRGTTCDCAARAAVDTPCNHVDDECNGTVDDTSFECSVGCVDLATDSTNCGGCGVVCGGGQVCHGSHCACPTTRPTICGTRCADTTSDPTNCGTCGTACPAVGSAMAACVASHCSLLCAMGTGDCDGDPANGCETDTRSSLTHCGACGHGCSFANATGVCSTGACTLGACAAGFANCDGDPANGCETDTRSSLTHCGGCGRGCAPPGGIGACAAGVCGLVACMPTFANCNTNDADGCEANTQTSPTNCGTCGHVCPGTGAPNTTAGCAAGACSLACTPGFGDCDGNMTNGCETNLMTTAHCGGCGVVCVVGQTCTGGACACPSGQSVCGGSCRDTSSDPGNCGTCGHGCTTGQSCIAGVCSAARFTGATGATWEVIAMASTAIWPGYSDYSPPGALSFYASTQRTFGRFDTSTDTWTSLPTVSSDFGSAGFFSGPAWVGNRLFFLIAGGVYRLDVAGGAWTALLTGVGALGGSQNAHDDSGHVYAVATDGRIATFDIASNAVSYQTFGMSPPATYPRIAWDSVSRLLYVAPNISSPSLYSFDPMTGAIRALTPIPEDRVDPTFCSDRSGHVYAVGSSNGTRVWQYQIAINSWVAMPTLPFDHDSNGACTVTDSGYLYITDTGGRLARLPLL